MKKKKFFIFTILFFIVVIFSNSKCFGYTSSTEELSSIYTGSYTDYDAYLQFLINYNSNIDNNYSIIIYCSDGSGIYCYYSLGSFYYDPNNTRKIYCTDDFYSLNTSTYTSGRKTKFMTFTLTDSEKSLSSPTIYLNLTTLSSYNPLLTKDILSLSDNSILAEKNCFVFDPPEPEEPDEPTTNTTTEYYDYTEHFEDIENKLYYMLHFYMTFDCLLLSIIVYLFLHFMLERRKI